jgi:hypothetical protein
MLYITSFAMKPPFSAVVCRTVKRYSLTLSWSLLFRDRYDPGVFNVLYLKFCKSDLDFCLFILEYLENLILFFIK